MSHSKCLSRLILASACLVTACDEETVSPTPAAPTVTPGPNIDHQTWTSWYIETDDPTVYAVTWLYFNTEHQNGTDLIGYIFHYDGSLIIDGYEVPEGLALRMPGTYTWERHIEASTDFHGHLLRVSLDMNAEASWMEGLLTIDGDLYQQYMGFIHASYITVEDDE